MNSRGVVFTISALVLMLAILSFLAVTRESPVLAAHEPELVALRIAGERFRDLERGIVDLDLNGNKKSVLLQGIPFSYSADSNRFTLHQKFPVSSAEIAQYHNSLNGFKVFFLNRAIEGLPDGILIDINVIQDTNWGGSNNWLTFLLHPSCTAYRFSVNQLQWENGNSPTCTSSFNPFFLRKTDLNISILDSREDLDSILCNGAACSANSFDSSNPWPFFTLRFDTNGCPGCGSFSPVSVHYNPAADYNVFVYCDSPGCFSIPLQFLFGNGIRGSRDSNQSVLLQWQIEFNQPVSRFHAADINYSIRVPDYNIIRTNNPTQIS